MTAAENSPNSHALKSAETSTNGASNQISSTGTNRLREETSEVNSSRKESFWSKFLDTTMVVGFLTLLATVVTFAIAQKVQTEDGRQKALNDYTNSMKELVASTQIAREDAKMTASLQNSRTFLVMRELDGDGDRKGQILRLLYEACLIPTDKALERCVTLESSRKDWQIGGKEDTRYNKLREAKVKLSGINLNGVVLEDASTPNMDLTGAFMKGANLENADLAGSNLTRTDFTKNKEAGCLDSLWDSIPIIDLAGDLIGWMVKPFCPAKAKLKGIRLDWAVLTDANLKNADLTQAKLIKAKLEGANLSNAILTDANLKNANLTRANLRGANLSNAILTDANLKAAIYDDKTSGLTDEQRNQMLKIEPSAELLNVDLSGQDLSESELQGAKLDWSNLSSANLSSANLSSANLSGVNLSGASLVGANLMNARLDGANLAGVTYCQTTMPDGSINNQNCP